MNINKYFWSLTPQALREIKTILKNPRHSKFVDRCFTLLSRCDDAKEVFSIIDRSLFIEAWPRVRRYWARTNQSPDFKAWWETVYEQLLQKNKPKKALQGNPAETFMAIGKIIKEKRVGRKISQRDFARQAGMTQPDISAIEAGKKNLTIETLSRLCKILGIKTLPL